MLALRIFLILKNCDKDNFYLKKFALIAFLTLKVIYIYMHFGIKFRLYKPIKKIMLITYMQLKKHQIGHI